MAAKCGAKVILSDDARLPKCLENCRRSCVANGLSDVEVVGITWGRFSPDIIKLPALDVILASDCFYDTKGRSCKFYIGINEEELVRDVVFQEILPGMPCIKE